MAHGSRVRLALPDRNGWIVSNGPLLHATHGATDTDLRVRVFRATPRASEAACREQLRLWAPEIPRPEAAEVVDRRSVQVPRGYLGSLDVGVRPGAEGPMGYVLMVTASLEDCVTAVARTRLHGPGGARVIADRLGTLVQALLSLERIGVDSRGPERQRPFR